MINDNIVSLPVNGSSNIATIGDFTDAKKVKMKDNNSNGGEPPMDKYVTHQELEASTEKILHQMDQHFADMQLQMDKRFSKIDLEINKTKNIADSANWKANWILGIISACVVGVVVASITTLLHLH